MSSPFRAGRDNPPVPIDVAFYASKLSAIDQGQQRCRGFIAASPRAVGTLAGLCAFGRVDAPQPNALGVDQLEGVAIDNPGRLRRRSGCNDEEDQGEHMVHGTALSTPGRRPLWFVQCLPNNSGHGSYSGM